MKSEAKNDIIKTIKEYLMQQQDVSFAYLFGSFIRSKKYRDIDIGIYLEPFADIMRIGSMQTALDKLLDQKADLVILNEAVDKKPVLGYQVISHGLLLFNRNEELHLTYKKRVLAHYFDTARLRKKMDQAFADRLESNKFGNRHYE